MGEAGGGLPENSPTNTQLTGAGETSPPAFATPYLRSLSLTPFVSVLKETPMALFCKYFKKAKLLHFIEFRG
jgi:hypothetical protein